MMPHFTIPYSIMELVIRKKNNKTDKRCMKFMYVHYVQWLHHLLRIYVIKSFATYCIVVSYFTVISTPPHPTDPTPKTHPNQQLLRGGVKPHHTFGQDEQGGPPAYILYAKFQDGIYKKALYM
jgi:hypothetical protein